MVPNVKEEEMHNEGLSEESGAKKPVAPQADDHKFQLIYWLIAAFIYMHIAGIYGITYIFHAQWSTLLFMYVYFVYGFMGITAGVHRLWAHRAYKAKWPLQLILVLAHSAVNQFSVIWWTQTHRLHHKYSDTDGDPSNSTRGSFFTHLGWVCVVRHPEAQKREQRLDIRDLENDPLLKYQRIFAIPIMGIMALILPSALPLLWGEDVLAAWHLNILRLIISYNALFAVNSIGHGWGSRPYDKNIMAYQGKWLSFASFGEGYHNFHHTFPWDYRSDEWGRGWNFTTFFIESFAKIGWAYDLKTAPQEVIEARADRTGDGTKPLHTH